LSEEEALLRAIRGHPGEDTPRLAYADWLDEHAGDVPGRDPQEMRDRAAFIRAQVKTAALPGGDPERSALEAQADALLKRYRPEFETSMRAD
jgi:uncharacterized protein (TIGR02996 family)